MHLTFWSWVPNIANAVSLFNSAHKNIQVTLDTIPTGSNGGYAKMLDAVKAGNPPCAAQVEYQEIPTFLLQNALVNIKPWVASSQSLFVPWQWNQGVYNGSVYAVPQASGPMALYYRKDVFSRDGIVTPPRTWAQYAQDAAIIHSHAPHAYITTFPVPDSAWYTALAWQAGTKWFGTSGDHWTVNIANAASQRVAGYWYGLVKKGMVKTENDFTSAWYKDLQDGGVVTWISASWGDAILRQNAPNTAGNWAVAPMPQWASSGFAASNWGGSSTAVLRGCPDPQAAAQFAVWLNTNARSINLLVTDGYGWPAVPSVSSIPSVTGNPKVFSFYGGQNINAVFQQADQNINESWGWIPNVQTTYDALDSAFASAANGNGTFASALTSAQRQTVASLSGAGLKVTSGP
ncbi:MAG: sugar ABC transporter substrate-binding protein [Streptosporangiaceae bacterium]|nr:sugar ABC transporter substrate-binding protein [Streptosporangiaceae bacterium]